MDNTTRINVEGNDSGFSSLLDRLRSRAKETYAELSREAQDYSQDTVEQLRYVEGEINSLKNATSQGYQADRLSSAQRYEQMLSGAKSPEEKKNIKAEYSDYLRGSRNEEKEEKLVGQLLKELLQEQKQQNAQDKRFHNEEQRTEDQNTDELRDTINGKDKPEHDRFHIPLAVDNLEDEDEPEDGGGDGGDGKGKDKDKKKSKDDNSVDKAVEVSSKTGFHIIPALLAAAGLAGISGVLGRAVEMGGQLQTTSLGANATTGAGSSALDGSTPDITDLGYTRAQAYDIGTSGAKARGFRGDYATETLNTLALMKGYGLDAGSIQGLDKNARYDNQNRTGTEQVANILGMFRGFSGAGKDGDFSRLAELMQMQNSLTAGLSKRMDNVSTAGTTAMLAKFTSLGGAFGDDRAAEKIQSIDGALANPDNQYAQALNYQVLRQTNPTANLWELKKAQEKGITAKGLLSGTLDSLAGSGMSEDLIKLQLSERFKGLNTDDIDGIYSQYSKNNDFFDDIDGNKSKQAQFGLNALGRGKANTGDLNQAVAKHSDAFASGGRLFINAIEKVVSGADSLVGSMFKVKDMTDNLTKSLDTMNASIEKSNGLKGNKGK